MTETQLRLQYAEKTWDIDFSENLDQVIEDDYVLDNTFYTERVFSQIKVVEQIIENLSAKEILNYVKNELNN